jgi:hypothetical protein
MLICKWLQILLAHWDPKSLKDEEEREVTLSSTKLMQLLRLFGSFASALFAQLSLPIPNRKTRDY